MEAIVLWLFVINLGIAFGAGIYEHRIVLPRWSGAIGHGGAWNAEAARADDTGRRFWAFVTTLPLTLLAAASLYAAWNLPGALGAWWRAAAAMARAERVATFAFFIPGMIRLMRQADSPKSRTGAARWAALNHVRHLFVLGSWIAALRAFGLFHALAVTRLRIAGQRRLPACSPHSLRVSSSHHQRPARSCCPGLVGRVQGSQPIEMKPRSCRTL